MFNLVLVVVMVGTSSDNGGPIHTRIPLTLSSTILATFNSSEECQAHMDVAIKGDANLLVQRDQPLVRHLVFCARKT